MLYKKGVEIMAGKPDEPGWRSYLEAARRLVAEQLTKEQYETYVSEDRLADVARWLEKGWSVEAYFQDSEWTENGINDDITYACVIIKPVINE